jgi:hypothetical protein
MLERLMGVVDRVAFRVSGDTLTVDGVPLKAMLYDEVLAPELGGQPTELVEYFMLLPASDCQPNVSVVRKGSLVVCRQREFEVVRVGEPDDTALVKIILKPLVENTPIGEVGV